MCRKHGSRCFFNGQVDISSTGLPPVGLQKEQAGARKADSNADLLAQIRLLFVEEDTHKVGKHDASAGYKGIEHAGGKILCADQLAQVGNAAHEG